MSASNKAKDKAQAAKGKVKKSAGKAVGNPKLEAKGKADQVKGNQAGRREGQGRWQEVTCFARHGEPTAGSASFS